MGQQIIKTGECKREQYFISGYKVGVEEKWDAAHLVMVDGKTDNCRDKV
jgi:hypothetical protein